TTARIIARALNCIGPDGNGGPTVDPCGACPECRAILADRHPDVLELDAASNNSVDDVRELRETLRYRPAQWGDTSRWHTYPSRAGGRWFGFDAVTQLDNLPPEILLVPLPGHTAGHAGVAIETE
ncbi:hypothetical protein ABTC76_19800, partial [Acinetobacter baumannii]